MPEATIEKEDGELLIKSGAFMFRKGGLYKNWYHLREFSAVTLTTSMQYCTPGSGAAL